MESCLANADPRIGVRCNSNRFEPSLEMYRTYDARLVYDCFWENRGAQKNFLHLLQSSEARFCMLLSDEDRIEAGELKGFLDFLDACDERVAVVSCSVFDLAKGRYFHRPEGKLSQMQVGGNAFAALSLAPTYMTGLVFSVKALASLDLGIFFSASPGNAYPHLDVAQQLLLAGDFRSYSPRFVVKGDDLKYGGDGYSHLSKNEETDDGNLNQNPSVYGPYARARQFFYREKLLFSMRSELQPAAYALCRMNLCLFFLRGVLRSPAVVRLPLGTNLRDEVEKALGDSLTQREFSGSTTARFFLTCIRLPAWLRTMVLSLLNRINRIAKKRFRAEIERSGNTLRA